MLGIIDTALDFKLQKRCSPRHIYANHKPFDNFERFNTNEIRFLHNGVEILNLFEPSGLFAEFMLADYVQVYLQLFVILYNKRDLGCILSHLDVSGGFIHIRIIKTSRI